MWLIQWTKQLSLLEKKTSESVANLSLDMGMYGQNTNSCIKKFEIFERDQKNLQQVVSDIYLNIE